MIIGGLQKFSLLDYPEHLSAIIFTEGCNFRCHFCYNPMLVWPNKVSESKYKTSSTEGVQKDYPKTKEDNLFAFLRERAGKLDAVVITGGEPTLHKDLPAFIKKIKKLDYKIKLDTNGTNPGMIEKLLDENLLDYIAMDIKASAESYDLATGVQPDLDTIKTSIKIIKQSGQPYEFRSTLVPHIHSFDEVKKMGEMIKGARAWYLQNFKSESNLVNDDFKNSPGYSSSDMEKFLAIAKQYAKECGIR